MPITRAEFERGRVSGTLAVQIREFLEVNEGHAFTWEELYNTFFPEEKKKWAHVVMGVVALSQLTSSKAIESRRLESDDGQNEVVYYAIARDHQHYR
jgi:hypothetical protein